MTPHSSQTPKYGTPSQQGHGFLRPGQPISTSRSAQQPSYRASPYSTSASPRVSSHHRRPHQEEEEDWDRADTAWGSKRDASKSAAKRWDEVTLNCSMVFTDNFFPFRFTASHRVTMSSTACEKRHNMRWSVHQVVQASAVGQSEVRRVRTHLHGQWLWATRRRCMMKTKSRATEGYFYNPQNKRCDFNIFFLWYFFCSFFNEKEKSI